MVFILSPRSRLIVERDEGSPFGTLTAGPALDLKTGRRLDQRPPLPELNGLPRRYSGG
jgi:hypothetical protein